MNKYVLFPSMITVLAIAIFIIVAGTMPVVLVFIPAVIISFIIYLNLFLKKAPDPERFLPLYLLLLGIQFLHFTEEYVTGFNVKLPGLLGQEVYPLDYWVSFNMIAYFIFILGAIVLFKRMREYLIIPIFFILAGVLFNSLAHIATSFYIGGYFPGLYTAIIYIIAGPLFIRKVVMEQKIS